MYLWLTNTDSKSRPTWKKAPSSTSSVEDPPALDVARKDRVGPELLRFAIVITALQYRSIAKAWTRRLDSRTAALAISTTVPVEFYLPWEIFVEKMPLCPRTTLK